MKWDTDLIFCLIFSLSLDLNWFWSWLGLSWSWYSPALVVSLSQFRWSWLQVWYTHHCSTNNIVALFVRILTVRFWNFDFYLSSIPSLLFELVFLKKMHIQYFTENYFSAFYFLSKASLILGMILIHYWWSNCLKYLCFLLLICCCCLWFYYECSSSVGCVGCVDCLSVRGWLLSEIDGVKWP